PLMFHPFYLYNTRSPSSSILSTHVPHFPRHLPLIFNTFPVIFHTFHVIFHTFHSYSTLSPSSSTNLQSWSTLSPSFSTLFHSSSTFYQQFELKTKMAAICQSADMFLGSKNLVLTFLYNFGSNIIPTIHHEINIF